MRCLHYYDPTSHNNSCTAYILRLALEVFFENDAWSLCNHKEAYFHHCNENHCLQSCLLWHLPLFYLVGVYACNISITMKDNVIFHKLRKANSRRISRPRLVAPHDFMRIIFIHFLNSVVRRIIKPNRWILCIWTINMIFVMVFPIYRNTELNSEKHPFILCNVVKPMFALHYTGCSKWKAHFPYLHGKHLRLTICVISSTTPQWFARYYLRLAITFMAFCTTPFPKFQELKFDFYTRMGYLTFVWIFS